jgi:hypothetical protein
VWVGDAEISGDARVGGVWLGMRMCEASRRARYVLCSNATLPKLPGPRTFASLRDLGITPRCQLSVISIYSPVCVPFFIALTLSSIFCFSTRSHRHTCPVM